MFEYKLNNTDWYSRAWEFTTAHGSFKTPIFMPVWTKTSVKGISDNDLDEMWSEIILNNTYHLFLRPWDDVIKHFGWVHKFQNYNKPILTDSWWFQVFSLGKSPDLVKITEEWVHFRNYINGSKHFFTAENVMDIQSNLWADIIMAFDECAPWDSTKEYARAAMERTHRWAERCVRKWGENEISREKEWLYPQALFPIIQWVTYDDLRLESAKFIWNLDTPWIAIWWLSVWETKEDMYRILDTIKDVLPKNKPRYLMGVWTPEDLIEAIDRWIDMFDCVLPTRLWRHWVAFSSLWNIKVKNLKHRLSNKPLDPNCNCKVCQKYSMWYLRHLTIEKEMYGMSLLSYHNLYLLIDLTKKAREAILKNKFNDFKKDFRSKYPKK